MLRKDPVCAIAMEVKKDFSIKWIDGKEHLVITFILDFGNGVCTTVQQELTYHETATLRYDLNNTQKNREERRKVRDIRWEDKYE